MCRSVRIGKGGRVRLALVALCVAVVSACGGGGDGGSGPTTPSPPSPVPTSIQITPASVDLAIGETAQLQAQVLDQKGAVLSPLPTGTTLTWASGDTTRLTVDASGLVRAVRPGSATITATAGSAHGNVAASVRAPQFQLDAAHAVTQEIPPDGGTIDVPGAAGVTYHLTIPLGALEDTTAITVTPVSALQDSPFEAVLGAVQFAPDGLKLLTPATLSVELPTAPTGAGTVFVVFSNDGADFDYVPGTVTGTTLTVAVPHFSGIGGVRIDDPSAPPAATGSTAGDDATNAIVAEIAFAAYEKRAPDPQVIAAALIDWYTAAVAPGLKAAAQDESKFLDGIGEWRYWRQEVIELDTEYGDPTIEQLVVQQVNDDDILASDALAAQVQRSLDECFAQRNTIPTKDAFYLQHAAEVWHLSSYLPELERAWVQSHICPRLVFATASLPDPLDPGQPAQLQVTVGITFDRTGSANLETGSLWPIHLVYSVFGTTSDGGYAVDLLSGGTLTKSLTPAGSADVGVVLDAFLNVDVDPAGMMDFNTDVLGNAVVSSSVAPLPPQIVYDQDFNDGSAPQWSIATITTAPRGQRYLGPFGNQTTTLSLQNLPAHDQVLVEFDFYTIETLDGNGVYNNGQVIGPDVITFGLDGTTLKTTTFSNNYFNQAWPDAFPGGDHPRATGSTGHSQLGYAEDWTTYSDVEYHITFQVPHSASSLQFSVTGSGQQGWPNEGWGLATARVTVSQSASARPRSSSGIRRAGGGSER